MSSLFPPGGPTLPAFRTLLLQGSFHPSSPIHLMSSHNLQSPKAKTIMLTASRTALTVALTQFSDEWLNQHGGDGRTRDASSRAEIYYPPSETHLDLLLSMLHVYEGSLYYPKITLPSVPSLIVLHEVSAFCLNSPKEPTLAAYLSLITRALSTVNFLSRQTNSRVSMVVFDSGLAKLRLPVVRPVSPDVNANETASQPSSVRRESVSLFVEKFFEWVGTIEAIPMLEIPSSQPEEASVEPAGGHMRMTLRRPQDSSALPEIWSWIVCTRMAGPHAGDKYFDWQ